MQQNTFQKTWAKIVAKAWSDPEFKKKLLSDPEGVLKSHGVEIPSGMKVVVNESTQNTCYLTIPPQPEGSLSEEALSEVAAGTNWSLHSQCR